MKSIMMMLIFATSFALAGNAEQAQPLTPRLAARGGISLFTASKRADVVKVVPHLAAASNWKSQVIIRNDLDFPINLGMDFYAADGLPASIIFTDSDGNSFVGDRFDFTLQAFELYTIEFEDMSDPNLINFQAFIFSDELESEYSVEAIFDNFQGSEKVATVGGGLQVPGDNFFMNVDQRTDAYTGNAKLRGLAVANIETGDCLCSVKLWGSTATSEALASSDLILGPLEKWVGTVDDLFEGFNILPTGIGLLDFDCDRLVAVTGLAFENDTPIVGSTPIDYYVFNDGKKSRRGR